MRWSVDKRESQTFKICARCSERKPLVCFHRSKACKDGHMGTCTTCRRAMDSERRTKHAADFFNKGRPA